MTTNKNTRLLKKAIKRVGTQEDVAGELGISPTYLSDILNGRRNISPTVAKRMETVLKIDGLLLLRNQVTEMFYDQ